MQLRPSDASGTNRRITRVGVMTFHWATNYGAVLQAFALQEFISRHASVVMIPFVPIRVRSYEIVRSLVRRDWRWFAREREVARFRRSYLRIGQRRICRSRALRDIGQDFDVVVTGSDQVWNETILLTAEKAPMLAYYLDFVPESKAKVAYAVSFGADTLSPQARQAVKSSIADLGAIGVRERSGQELVSDLGRRASLTVDPTILLGADGFEQIVRSASNNLPRFGLFSYIINDNGALPDVLREEVASRLPELRSLPSYDGEAVGVSDWLAGLRSSEFIVTNSFHAVAFAVLFHKKFVACAIPGSAMNDRIRTLLQLAGLPDRYVEDINDIPRLVKEAVDTEVRWDQVDDRLSSARDSSESFLLSALHAAGIRLRIEGSAR